MIPVGAIAANLLRAGGGGSSDIGPLMESTSLTTDTLTLPVYSAGDIIFLQVFYSDAGGHAWTAAAPTGWTEVGRVAGFSNTATVIVYRRVMTGGEGATITINMNGFGSVQARAFTLAGVNTGGAITEGVTSATDQPIPVGVNNLVSAAVTTAGANRTVLNFWGTLRGTDGTMAESVDAWTDIYMVNTSALSLDPHIVASKLTAASSGAQATETRTESQTGSGDILMVVLSFGVIML